MKELNARAEATTAAAPGDTLALLRDLEGYPRWYPDGVRTADVRERDRTGAASRVRAVLHLAQGPLQRDFDLDLAVSEPEPGVVRLARIPHDRRDAEVFTVTWRVSANGAGSRIALALDANLDVPRFLPVGAVGTSLAEGFVAAAARALG